MEEVMQILNDSLPFDFSYKMFEDDIIVILSIAHLTTFVHNMKRISTERNLQLKKKKNYQLQKFEERKSKTLKKTMPTRQNRRAQKGKPKSSTSFDSKKKKPQRNGSIRQGKSRSQTPKPKRKQSTSSWSSFQHTKKILQKTKLVQFHHKQDIVQLKKSNLAMRSNRNVLHPNTCTFWNKSQCKKGKEYEYAHFHFKFFHKTTIPTTNGTSQVINQQYSQQVVSGNLLVDISQISFMNWHQVQQLAKIMNTGVFQLVMHWSGLLFIKTDYLKNKRDRTVWVFFKQILKDQKDQKD